MKKMNILISIFIISMVLLVPVGCKRRAGEVWEDTKTAKRYMGRGMRSLAGKQGESRQVKSQAEFAGDFDEDYIPLHDEDLDSGLYASIPQSKERPGDPGSSIPGIEGFSSTSSSELAAIFKKIYFPYNSDMVRDPVSLKAIAKIASYLKKNSKAYVFIEGHCDERGPEAYNLTLGSRRSNMVRRLLVKEGVDSDRLFTVSYGKERPIAMGHVESAWRLNRRTEFKIYNKK